MKKGKRLKFTRRGWEHEDVVVRSAEMRRNLESEPIFRRSVEELLPPGVGMEKKSLIDSACEVAGCAQETGRRYLDKMCSGRGNYEYFPDKKDDKDMWFVRRKDIQQDGHGQRSGNVSDG
jgi:hypothetical protein